MTSRDDCLDSNWIFSDFLSLSVAGSKLQPTILILCVCQCMFVCAPVRARVHVRACAGADPVGLRGLKTHQCSTPRGIIIVIFIVFLE